MQIQKSDLQKTKISSAITSSAQVMTTKYSATTSVLNSINQQVQQKPQKAVSTQPTYQVQPQMQVSTAKTTTQINLKSHLPVVVLLQSVEIERLHGEVESWKFKYNDLDRRISIHQGLEEQIRIIEEEKVRIQKEYQLSIERYKKESLVLLSTNEKLQEELSSLLKKYEESESRWKSKLRETEDNSNTRIKTLEKKNQELIQQLEFINNKCQQQIAQLQSEYERQKQAAIESVKHQFQLEREQMQGQIKKFKDYCDSLQRENEEFRIKCKQYELLQEKFTEVSNTAMNLRTMVQQLNQDIENWKIKSDRLQGKIDELQQVNQKYLQIENQWKITIQEIENLTHINKQSNYDIEQLQGRLMNYELKNQELQKYVQDYENQIKQVEKEINRLNSLINQKTVEINEFISIRENLQYTIQELSQKYETQTVQYTQLEASFKESYYQCSQFQQSNQDWEAKYALLVRQIEGYKTLDNLAVDYDIKINQIPTQISQQIAEFCEIKKKEMDEWRKQYENVLKQVNTNSVTISQTPLARFTDTQVYEKQFKSFFQNN